MIISSGRTPAYADGHTECLVKNETEACSTTQLIPRCLETANCELVNQTSESTSRVPGAPANHFTQTYTCSNDSKQCTEYSTLSTCTHSNAWGWDKQEIKGSTAGFAEAQKAFALLEGIEKGMSEDDIYLFSGKDMRCHYMVGNFALTGLMIVAAIALMVMTGGAGIAALSNIATVSAGNFSVMMSASLSVPASMQAAAPVVLAFLHDAPNSKALGAQCCKKTLEAEDQPFKFGGCSSDEVRLAAAKRKDLAKYMGEYCSKKTKFPRQCVEKTKRYCVFDDMLAFVVNEEGRKQLDELADAEPNRTETSEISFSLYAPTPTSKNTYAQWIAGSGWTKVQTGVEHAKVWYWKYPAYCKSKTDQDNALRKFLAESNAEGERIMKASGLDAGHPTSMTIDRDTGSKTGQYTAATASQASTAMTQMAASAVANREFRECPETSNNNAYFMYCGHANDQCDLNKAPLYPTDPDRDPVGGTLDPNFANIGVASPGMSGWEVAMVNPFPFTHSPEPRKMLPGHPTFEALKLTIASHISMDGSCKLDSGDCVFKYFLHNRTHKSGGFKVRVSDSKRFPLYTSSLTAGLPSVDYLPVKKTAQGDNAALAANEKDATRGGGDAVTLSGQQFIFRPNFQAMPTGATMHDQFLLEYAPRRPDTSEFEPMPTEEAAKAFAPILVPTNLPEETPGFWPYGDPSTIGQYFYLSGSCGVNSQVCNYSIQTDVWVERHPWGTAKNPRCWGFSLDQMAALDFDRMDLSRWINSLELGVPTEDDVYKLSEETETAMTNQVVSSVGNFYSTFNKGEKVSKPGAGPVALYLNTDRLPQVIGDYGFSATTQAEVMHAAQSTALAEYVVEVGIPGYWPDVPKESRDRDEDDKVSNVIVDWGDGTPTQTLTLKNGSYIGWHYYGVPEGEYQLTVTLETVASGKQTLGRKITVVPDKGDLPKKRSIQNLTDFNSPGLSGNQGDQYIPATTPDGEESIKPGSQYVTNRIPGFDVLNAEQKKADDLKNAGGGGEGQGDMLYNLKNLSGS